MPRRRQAGRAVDLSLTARCDGDAAVRFGRGAIEQNGVPNKVNIDKSGANTAGIAAYNPESETGIESR